VARGSLHQRFNSIRAGHSFKTRYVAVCELVTCEFFNPVRANHVLEYLNLRDNFITGSIPTELGEVPLLAVIHVDVNELSGRLPVELTALSSTLSKKNAVQIVL
jgi:hypothetical protein